MAYDFYVNDQKHQSERSELAGLNIKALARVDWPQQLYLEEEGSTPDRCISDSTVVNIAEKIRRFYLVPSIINNG